MLYDANGRYQKIGTTHQELIFNTASETALPAWLTTSGISPIVTFNNPGSGLVGVNLQTKLAAPTSGDIAGIQTAFNIKTSDFSEIGFFVSGITSDSGASATNQALQMACSDFSTNGILLQSYQAIGGLSQMRSFPDAVVNGVYQFADSANVGKRKTMGIVIRPYTKDVFFTLGDPDDGAGVVWFMRGRWVDTISPFVVQCITRTAAQRSMSLTKIKLRLSSY